MFLGSSADGLCCSKLVMLKVTCQSMWFSLLSAHPVICHASFAVRFAYSNFPDPLGGIRINTSLPSTNFSSVNCC